MSYTIKDSEKIKKAQGVLFEKVSDLVKINGVVDDLTKGAIEAFEYKNGLPMTGELSYKIYHMLVDEKEAEKPEEKEELLDVVDDETIDDDDDAEWE